MSTELLEQKMEMQNNPELTAQRGWHFPVPEEFYDFFRTVNDTRHTQPCSYFKYKYAIDRMMGYVLLPPAAVLIAICWIAVKLSSKGPGFFVQTRVGLGGKTFQLIKLRTMIVDAEAKGIVWSSGKDDPRITRVGKILRTLHLDELPQVWNVARGEMSLVGPRPERPEITECLEELIPGYHLRHNVKPGVTGLSQVNLEPDTHINITRRKQILDLRYIGKANLWLDIRTLAATALRMVGVKGQRVMEAMGLEQQIKVEELRAVDFEFDKSEADLWQPGKPLPR